MHTSRQEQVLLGVLRDDRERYPAELARNSDGALRESSIYTQLLRAKEEGLVDSRREELPQPAERPPRRLYQITGAGARALPEHQKQVFGSLGAEVVSA